MTTKNDEQERRDFEKLFHRFDLRPSIRVGHYSDLRVEFMWEAWQARAALQSQEREVASAIGHDRRVEGES